MKKLLLLFLLFLTIHLYAQPLKVENSGSGLKSDTASSTTKPPRYHNRFCVMFDSLFHTKCNGCPKSYEYVAPNRFIVKYDSLLNRKSTKP